MNTAIPKGWSKTRLGTIFDFKNGLNKEKKYFGKGYPIVNYTDVYKNNDFVQEDLIGKVEVNKSELRRYEVKTGDVFFTRTSETIDEIGFSSVASMITSPTVFSGFVLRAREKQKTLENGFKKYCFNTHQSRKEIMRKSSMTTRALTSGKHLSEVEILVPPLQEQKRIADILSTWDRAIELKDKLINKKTELLDATIQRYKRKLFKSIDFDTWTKTKLKKVFSVRKEKKYESEGQPLYSFTIEKGVSPKTDRYNRSFLVKGDKKYKVTKFDDLVYNPANLKYGAISVNKNPDSVLISPIYETLYVKDTNKYDIDFFKYFLTTSEMISYYKSKVEGTLVERSAVKVDQFLLFTIDVPEYNVQRRVTNHLNTIDKSIDILKRQKEMLELQKKGLMQRLLTGQVRVQV